VNASAVVCTVPATEGVAGEGEVAVEVSVNGVEYTASGTTLHYFDAVLIQSISPVSGPSTGGTYITFEVKQSLNYSSLVCSFEGGSSPAIGISTAEKSFMCVTPEASAVGVARVEVLSPDQIPLSSFEFTFYSPPQLIAVYPSSVNEFGGNEYLLRAQVSCPLSS